jgi:hypothetical protein
MESARLQNRDKQAIAEEHDTDKAEDNDSDERELSSEEESDDDDDEQEEEVQAEFERIIAGFSDGKLNIDTTTNKAGGYDYLKLIKRVCDTEMLRTQNNDHKTPLHIAVKWERCTESQMGVVRALVNACNTALDVNMGIDDCPSLLSVFCYHEKTRREAKKADAATRDKKEERSGHKPGERAAPSSRNPNEAQKVYPEDNRYSPVRPRRISSAATGNSRRAGTRRRRARCGRFPGGESSADSVGYERPKKHPPG